MFGSWGRGEEDRAKGWDVEESRVVIIFVFGHGGSLSGLVGLFKGLGVGNIANNQLA